MARNIEIKARIDDIDAIRIIAESLSAGCAEEIYQEDYFFNAPEGRLKLRVLGPNRGELIFYERSNQPGPKTSVYSISRSVEPATLKAVLQAAYGIRGIVKKTRLLMLCGRTRIHLDKVENLGSFLELEVVLAEGEDEEAGKKEADELMAKLQVRKENLVDCAYLDLIDSLR